MPRNRCLVLFVANPSNPIKRFKLAQKAVACLNASLNAQLIVASGVPHEAMPLYMNACDVLLLTSVHEGSPTVVKEALACNLPVVSIEVGDVRQRISAVDGCVVCADDQPETIAAGLAQVLSSAQQIDGRSTVLDLDEKTIAKKVISVYQQSLSHA